MVEEFSRATMMREDRNVGDPRRMIKIWFSEVGEGVVLFSNASHSLTDGRSGIAVVSLNFSDCSVELVVKSAGHLQSPLEAELLAIAEGINWAKGMQRKNFLFLSDCKEAVQAINGNQILWNGSGYTLDKIKEDLR